MTTHIKYSGCRKKEHRDFELQLKKTKKDDDSLRLFLAEAKKTLGLSFEFVVKDKVLTLTEEYYTEPVLDPMTIYLHEQDNFAGVRTAYELGFVEEEEYQSCCDYMKSVYPSEIAKMSIARRPDIMDKFRTGR